jgi:hypothetical protein
MLSAMLSFAYKPFMLSVIMVNVIMMRVVMFSVMARLDVSVASVSLGFLIAVKEQNYSEIWSCDLYHKHITIVNYDSNIVSKFGASLPDDARVVIYNCHMFILQATGVARW